MSTLYLVSTPIGNLGDLSSRAERVLRDVQRILAEDTRRSRILTDRVGAEAPLVSLHQHNEAERTRQILGWLDDGEDLALVTDAGTPIVSDPGGRVVAAVAEAGHTVVPIPGPSAVLAALVGSGMPAERFTFLGFVPRKGADRTTTLREIAESPHTTVLFESPQRLGKLLGALRDAFADDRAVCVARELTKVHEEFVRGSVAELADRYADEAVKGEVTVVVAGHQKARNPAEIEDEARSLARALLEDGMKASEAAKELANRLDLARNDAYRIVHDELGGPEGV